MLENMSIGIGVLNLFNDFEPGYPGTYSLNIIHKSGIKTGIKTGELPVAEGQAGLEIAALAVLH